MDGFPANRCNGFRITISDERFWNQESIKIPTVQALNLATTFRRIPTENNGFLSRSEISDRSSGEFFWELFSIRQYVLIRWISNFNAFIFIFMSYVVLEELLLDIQCNISGYIKKLNT